MIPLPQIINKNGFKYNQVLRGKKTCIYAQWYENNIIGYEVFIIRLCPDRFVKGKFLVAREKFPRNEDFGYTAWSINTLERALKVFKELETKKCAK